MTAVPGDQPTEWESGVGGAQCVECGRTTIVRGFDTDDDIFGEANTYLCRPCATGEDEAYFELDDEEVNS